VRQVSTEPAERRPSSAPAIPVEVTSLASVLRNRAAERPDDAGYIFLPDRRGERLQLTYSELYTRARAVAVRLAEHGNRGDRAALLFPPGLDFVVAFFGCLLAGIIAVPLMIPRRDSARDASAALLADCSPRFAMTSRELVTVARPDLAERFSGAELEWLFVDAATAESNTAGIALPNLEPADIAFLQYTSGSTSTPKGVIVSHDNLLHNLEMIRIAFGNTPQSTHVTWVPHYHDMGLILGILQSLYVGALCVLMAPVSFFSARLAGCGRSPIFRQTSPAAPISPTTAASNAIVPRRCTASICRAGSLLITAQNPSGPRRSSGLRRPSRRMDLPRTAPIRLMEWLRRRYSSLPASAAGAPLYEP